MPRTIILIIAFKTLDICVYILYTAAMEMKFKNRNKISYSFLRLMTKLGDIDRKLRYYGTDQPLYEAEIHMIKSIKENAGIHVTGLADMLGVTKGAVSQILKKIENKGMIIKKTSPDNLSKLVLILTDKGETAYAHHETLHQEFDEIFYSVLDNYPEDMKIFLKNFLYKLEAELSERGKNN